VARHPALLAARLAPLAAWAAPAAAALGAPATPAAERGAAALALQRARARRWGGQLVYPELAQADAGGLCMHADAGPCALLFAGEGASLRA